MELPKRKPTRLKRYDYSQNGYYFVTICTHNKQKILSDITVGEGLCALPKINLSYIGKLVEKSILYINENYDDIRVDKYVIMPNHIHMILVKQSERINEFSAGGRGDPPLQIYNVIGNLKSYTTTMCGCKLWQRSFHDHIIRGQKDYEMIWNYIEGNPSRWTEDCFYIE